VNDSSTANPALTEGRAEPAGLSWWACIEIAGITYCSTTLLVLLGVFLALSFFEGTGERLSPRKIRLSDDPFLVATTHWDGQWCLQVASEGYFYDPGRMSSVAFFPLYPMLVAAVFRATGMPLEWAGLLVAHVLLIAAFVFLAAYVAERYPRQSPQLAAYVVLAFGLFPTTFFMRMTYSESTFLALAVLAMFGMERGWRPLVVAGIVGLATAARPVGVALVPVFWLYVWQRAETGPHPRPLSRARERGGWRRLAPVVGLTPVALWGLLAYMAFQYAEFGEPLAFAKTQSHWRSRGDVGWGEKALALAAWEPIWSAYMPSSPGYAGRRARELPAWANLQLANPVFFVATAALVGLGAARGWLTGGEVLLSAGLLLIPYVTRGFEMCMASQGRYASLAFPVYLVLGRLLRGAPLAVSVGALALSGAYLAIYSALFAAGYLMI
jgi:hypothetical protein